VVVFKGEKSVRKLHASLCRPSVTRLTYFIRSRNVPYSVEDIKRLASKCHICCERKLQFHRPEPGSVVKATHQH